MFSLEDIHAGEATLGKDIKLQYEARPGTRGENQPSQNVPRRIPGKDGNGRQAHQNHAAFAQGQVPTQAEGGHEPGVGRMGKTSRGVAYVPG